MLCTQGERVLPRGAVLPSSPGRSGLSCSAHVRAWKSSWATRSPALHALLMRMLASGVPDFTLLGAQVISPKPLGRVQRRDPGQGPEETLESSLTTFFPAPEGPGGDPVTPSSATRAPSGPGPGGGPWGSQDDSRGRAPVASQPLPGVKGGSWVCGGSRWPWGRSVLEAGCQRGASLEYSSIQKTPCSARWAL